MNGHGVDTRWFQNLLADKRLSQRQLAKRLGLDPAAVSLMLRGKRKMSVTEASELARFLGVEMDEVLLHAGSTPTVPVKAPAGLRGGVARVVAVDQPKAVIDAGGAGSIEIPVPMSDGTVATLLLPRALGRADADRIAAVVQALALP